MFNNIDVPLSAFQLSLFCTAGAMQITQPQPQNMHATNDIDNITDYKTAQILKQPHQSPPSPSTQCDVFYGKLVGSSLKSSFFNQKLRNL